jgi:outer membrane receptor protein involved in Fe transport
VNLDLAGDYQQRRINTGVAGSSYEFLENDIEITNLVVNFDFDWGNITSSSSLINYESALETDLSHITFIFDDPSLPPVLANNPFYSNATGSGDVFTEELRISSQFEGPLQFIAGLYYEDRESGQKSPWLWSGDPLQDPGFQLSNLDLAISTEQKAFFGELSYTISDQLTATLGGRYFDYESEDVRTLSFFGSPSPSTTSINETGQTYKINLSYTPNENTLVYGQWAEGFRIGRGQAEGAACVVAGFPTPSEINSDTSENFELGLKTSLIDNRITLNTALYRIDWEGIPVTVNPVGSCFQILNAGKAQSEGVELELQGRLTENFQFDMSASYGESTLEENSSIGNKGDNLPGSADVNASIGLQYAFTLAGHDSFARIDYVYIGEYYSNVAETGVAVGDFGQLHLKAGIDFDQVAVDLFINNLTNDDGLTWVDSVNAGLGVNRASRIRPRTIGLNVNYQF